MSIALEVTDMAGRLLNALVYYRGWRSSRSNCWQAAVIALLCASLACLGNGQPALVFSPDQLPDATLGQPYSQIITITQNVTPVGQMSVLRAELPPGLTFAFQKGQSAGEIKGVPSTAGTFKFTVSAWCFGTNVSGQAGHRDYQLIVH